MCFIYYYMTNNLHLFYIDSAESKKKIKTVPFENSDREWCSA